MTLSRIGWYVRANENNSAATSRVKPHALAAAVPAVTTSIVKPKPDVSLQASFKRIF